MLINDLWRFEGRASGIKNFAALDGLRGYMAWWVVVGHALQVCGIDKFFPKILYSGLGVSVFIALSGFVCTHLLLEKKESYGVYITRRAFRIFPIYWFAIACAIVVIPAFNSVNIGPWRGEVAMQTARIAAVNSEFWTHLGLHVVLAHGLIPDNWLPFSSSAFLSPAWSLSLEWQFYLVAPLLVAGLVRPAWNRLMMACGMLALWYFFTQMTPLKWQYPAFLPLMLNMFLMGILSRVYLPMLARHSYWIIPAALISAFVTSHNVKIPVLIWAVFMTATCFEVKASKKVGVNMPLAERLLCFLAANRIARSLGQASYSTYLIHFPLFALCAFIASSLFGGLTQQLITLSTIVAMLLLVPLSFVLYNLIERRFVKIGSNLTKPRTVVVPA